MRRQLLSTVMNSVNYNAIHIIMRGESNSGGQSLNTNLSASELLARPSVQILYNTDLSEFQDLKISDPNSNNVLGHSGLDPTFVGIFHGWEAGLANEVEGGAFKFPKVYLTKTGQGGSKVGNWVTDYNQFQTKGTERVIAAKNLIQESNPLEVGWVTIGINDALNSTTDTDYYNDLKTMIETFKSEINGNIYITKFDRTVLKFDPLIVYNDRIDQLASELPYLKTINTNGYALKEGDIAHWSADSMKAMVTEQFIPAMFSNYPSIKPEV